MLYFICTLISNTLNLLANFANIRLLQLIAISKVLSAAFVFAQSWQEKHDPAKNEKR